MILAPKVRAPIVLVHGLIGYDRLRLCGWTVASYFARIPQFLRSSGNRVLVAQLSPTASVSERATELKNFLDVHAPGEQVHLLAHSMGGLDSRYMISRQGMAARVLSLTMLGTPHRGTAFADWGIRRFERLIKPILQRLAFPHEAFYDLTTERCRQFNAQVPDAPQVRYFSVAGRHKGSWLSPQWRLSHEIILRAEGPNDALVSLASASYGESTEVWEGDHISLVNWFSPLAQGRGLEQQRLANYASLVRRLADAGF